MNRFVRGVAISAALLVPLALASCSMSDDLTRSKAEELLDGPAFAKACIAKPEFVQGGLERARANGVVAAVQSWDRIMGPMRTDKIADSPDGDEWQAGGGGLFSFSDKTVAFRKLKPLQCLSGHAKVTAIADAPMSRNGSYKIVDFEEDIDLPPELEKLQPYVYRRYAEQATFQKTDAGWRVLEVAH